MNKKINPKEWAEDFQLFMESSEASPPRHIRDAIFQAVKQDLNPSLPCILTKLGGIHVFAGTVSLFLCSQFGFGEGYNITHIFMNYGMLVCMAFCGALFLSLTFFIAGFILSPEELRKIRKTCYAPIFLLSFSSLVIFFIFGAEVALDLALFWFLGASISGALFVEISLGVRRIILLNS